MHQEDEMPDYDGEETPGSMDPGPQPAPEADQTPKWNDPSRDGEAAPGGELDPGPKPAEWEDQTPKWDDPSRQGSG